MTRRRHPAQASRILSAGLSAATMLGIVAVLAGPPVAAPPPVAPPQVASGSVRTSSAAVVPRGAGAAPPKVALRRGGSGTAWRPPRASAPVTTTGPS